MPIWIPEYLTKDKVETSDDQTLYVDLPEKEQISFLKVQIKVTNNTTVNNLRSILDPIEKFEVIADGVKTIYNLEPEIASYIQFLTMGGNVPDHRFIDAASAVNRIELIIPFGRFPFDEEYMLDTSLYDSVQLRIPYTLDLTYEATGTLQHTIVMYRPLEKLEPVGFIRSRVIQKETSNTAVETITHKLPMTYPWYYLGVRVDDIDQDINTDLTAVKLNIDEGRLILADLKIDEILSIDKDRFPNPNAYSNHVEPTGLEDVHTFGNSVFVGGAVSMEAADNVVTVTGVIGEQATVNVYVTAGTAAGDPVTVSLDAPSPNPHSCITLYDGRKEPFPAASYTQAKVEYEMAAYESVLQTFIQEVVLGALS